MSQGLNLDREIHLDGLRGLAALNVVIFHTILCFDRAFASGAGIEAHFGWEMIFAGAPFVLLTHGTLPVMIFFVLSGYVLAKFLERSDLGLVALVIRRYIRFSIPIMFTTIISYVLVAIYFQPSLFNLSKSTWLTKVYQQAISFPAALQEGLYGALFGLIPQNMSYNPSLWTMSVEFAGSLLLIFVFQLTRLFNVSSATRRIWHCLIFSAICLVGHYSYLGLFAFGATLASLPVIKSVGKKIGVSLIVAGAFLGSVPWSAVPWWGIDFTKLTVAFPVWLPLPMSSIIEMYSALGALLIFYAALSFSPLQRVLIFPFVQFLGRISFPLYLIHLPILVTLIAGLALSLDAAGLSYGFILVIVLAS